MKRVLAFGDTQIGVPTVGLLEQRKVLDQIVRAAVEENVSLVLHGGDVFEGPVVTPEMLRMFLDATQPLRDAGIPMLIIRGNGRHDMATRPVSALDVLSEIAFITVSERPEVIVLNDIAVVTLPWVHPRHLLAQANGVDHGNTAEVTQRLLEDIAGDLYDQAASREDPKRWPTILLAHWFISGSRLPSGLPIDQVSEPILDWATLDKIGFDIVIGAHNHEPQVISDPDFDNGPGIVVGSPQPLNHGEQGDRGAWLISFDVVEWDMRVNWDQVIVESQRFVTLDVDFNDGEDFSMLLEHYGDWSHIQDAIVRVRYQATEEIARRIDHARITDALLQLGAAKVTIQPKIIRAGRVRAEAITDQLGPLEALDAYCQANDIQPPLKTRMQTKLDEWFTAA